MLNKIKSIFKDGELEKEVEILRESLTEREFLYNELSRTNIVTLQKNKDLENYLVEERRRNQNLKDEYVSKIVAEMDLVKKLKNEKQELEEDILNLKAEFPKLEAAYSEEYEKRLKSKLKIEEEKLEKKILELQNEYSAYFFKETEKFKLKIESIEKEKIELQKTLMLEKSDKENLTKEILILKDKINKLEEQLTATENLYLEESLSKENLEKSLVLVEREKEELQKTLTLEKLDKENLSKEILKLKDKISKLEAKLTTIENLYLEESLSKENLEKSLVLVEREKEELQKTLMLEKSGTENLSKEMLSLKDKVSKLEALEEKLAATENICLEESLLKEDLKKSLELIEKEKEDLQKTLEQEKNEKLKRLEEIESLKNDILKIEEAHSNEVLDKNKVLKELKSLEISYENLEEDIIKEVRRKESLDEELLKVKIELQVYRSRQDEIIKLKEDFVNDLKSKFSLEMNYKDNLIKKEKEKKEELLEEIEGLKAELVKIENFKLQNNSEEIKVNENIENLHSKESSANEEVEENLANKKLENNKNEINEYENIMDEKVESVREIKAKELKSNWLDKEKFLDNKNDLLGLLKTFEAEDFMEMYLEGKKRGVLKSLKDKDFTNIMTRLKLNLPLSDMILEKIENFYEDLMKDIYPKEIIKNQEIFEQLETDYFKEDCYNREEFDIESYTADDWCRIYEIAKEFRLKDWLQKHILTLWRYEERDLLISDSQYATIRRNYFELYEVLKKFEKEKKNSFKNTKSSQIIIYNDLLPKNDKKSSEIQEELKENTPKNFNEILEISLKSGSIDMKDLQEINFENEDGVYDIYEAIEIIEERGIRINY